MNSWKEVISNTLAAGIIAVLMLATILLLLASEPRNEAIQSLSCTANGVCE